MVVLLHTSFWTADSARCGRCKPVNFLFLNNVKQQPWGL